MLDNMGLNVTEKLKICTSKKFPPQVVQVRENILDAKLLQWVP